MASGLAPGNWSIKQRLLVTVMLFCIGLLALLFVLFAYHKRETTVADYVETARSITLVVEGAREEMEIKWQQGVFTAEQLKRYVAKGEMNKVLAIIPVVTAWQTAMKKAKEGGYTFRVPKVSPRNPKNQPDVLELKALEAMKASDLNSIYQIDPKLNAVRFYRAVRLTKSCLLCHGDPATSKAAWGNDKGLDPTGVPMENWKAGEIHGAFEVILSLDAADRVVTSSLTLGGGIAVAILVVGFFIILYIARSISKPIEATAEAIRTASKGDFTTDMDQANLDRGDEIGQMMRDLDSMNQNLSDTMREVTEASITVADTAAEISQGNQDLADRTQQQASAIEETAAAIEQMTASVKQNADNASQANLLAKKTADKASEGGQTVEKTVEAMSSVTEASNKISEIIGVVNEIAFQTNLLALNAAVEAARAGEAGRGFAVVAGEVRNLAGRSAAAAKQIQDLITDSVNRVEQGNQMVAASGRILGEIIESVQGVAETVAEISAASQEQAMGIDEVNRAVAQMDQGVQQNAALVEEAASSSEVTATTAGNLNEMVHRFKIRPEKSSFVGSFKKDEDGSDE